MSLTPALTKVARQTRPPSPTPFLPLFNLTKVTLQSRSHDMDSHTFDPSTNGRAAPRRCAPAQTDEIEKSSHRPTAVGQPSRRWAMGQRLGRGWPASVVPTPQYRAPG